MSTHGGGKVFIRGSFGVALFAGGTRYPMWSRILAALWLSAPFPLTGQTAPSGSASATTAFVDVAVIPMDRDRLLVHQTVVVRGDRVVALRPARRVEVPTDGVRIDGRGKFLIPGLADMHAHLGYGYGSRGDAEPPASVSDELFALLANGVTTVRDMHSGGRPPRHTDGGNQTWRLELRRRIATGQLLGPRIYTAGDPDWSSPETVARSIAELKLDGHDFVKVSGLATQDLSDSVASRILYDSVASVAARVGLRVVGHAPALRDGVRRAAATWHWASLEHLYEYLEYIIGVDGRWDRTDGRLWDARLLSAPWLRPDYQLDRERLHALATALRRADTWSCPTLVQEPGAIQLNDPDSSHVAGINPSESLPAPFVRVRKFDMQIVKALADAKAGLLLGTDFNFNNAMPGFAVADELMLLVRAGLSPYQALETGTRNMAEFLGTLDSTGTVAEGKRADLVLLYGDPRRDIRYASGPAGVMIGGHWLSRSIIDAHLDAMLSDSDDTLGHNSDAARYHEALRRAHARWLH